MKNENSINFKLKEFYNHSQHYMERLDRHGEETFGEYIKICHALIPTGSSIIDCGSGTGLSSYLLSESGFRITGIDISSMFTLEASKRYLSQSNLCFLIGDVTHMPFHNNVFDAVCSCNMLEHVTDVKATLKEMCRIMKSGGVVIIIAPSRLDSIQHLRNCIKGVKTTKCKPWEESSRIKSLFQFIRTTFLTVLKAASINNEIYYLNPLLQDDENTCGQDYDATWLANKYDVAHILKELGITIKYTSSERSSDDKFLSKMKKIRLTKVLQYFYIIIRGSFVIVGRKE